MWKNWKHNNYFIAFVFLGFILSRTNSLTSKEREKIYMKVTWVLNEGCICTALLLPTQLLNIIEMNKGLQIRKLIMWINFLVLVHILYPFFESLCWSTDSSKSKKEHLQKRVKVKYTEQIRNATDNIYNIILQCYQWFLMIFHLIGHFYFWNLLNF